MRLVPLNMLKLSSFFLPAQISSIVFLGLLPRTVVCVCVGGGGGGVCVCVWGGGSRRNNHSNIYHDPAIGYGITCVDRCWRVGQWLQMHFTPTTRVGTCVR